jgi:DNA modification methylase
MAVRILIGDVRARLKELPDESVHCVVTSPPYWGLRDYGVAGQLGLEPTLGEHLDVMVNGVFAEVWRVLRKDGTCWVNYGDCYATTPNGRSAAATKAAGNDDRTFRDKPFSTIGPIYDPEGGAKGGGLRGANKGNAEPPQGRVCAGGALKPKDLCMIPNRFAIAMQDAGWWVRSEIIWHKPNPMPESIRDRPASSHEKVFLFTKSERYWYDGDAVREPMSAASIERLSQDVENQIGSDRAHAGGKTNGRMKAVAKGNAKSFRGGVYTGNRQFDNDGTMERDSHGNAPNATGDRNLRNVWTIPTAAFSEAHFATFPPALVEVCIKAGCPKGGTVLDPFGGAGTTGLVADRLKRNAILIELNPEYAEIARKRIEGDAGMFGSVEVAA